MKIYLMRHGETTSDVENLYGGDYEDHLTEKGQNQAVELAKKLMGSKIEIIYSSPRWRAKETSDILSQQLNCPVEIMEDLRERNAYGHLTGLNRQTANEKYPEDVEMLKHYSNTIRGAETYEDFKKRIIAAFDQVAKSHRQIVGILTHGGPIRCLFREKFGAGELEKLDDCALFELDINDNNIEVTKMSEKKIKVKKDGPYFVSGNVPLDKESIKTKDDCPDSWEKNKEYLASESYCLCRCGRSKTMPYCDNSHLEGFDGTETAKNIPHKDQAKKVEGPKIDLYDAVSYCASAKFCDCGKGIWRATVESEDQESKEQAIKESCNCPSGRLVVCDKKGTAIEPNFSPSISITKHQDDIDGPIWVKGGIPIESAEGEVYEKRNRVTLCRCGKSCNKPFCDGSHIQEGISPEGD